MQPQCERFKLQHTFAQFPGRPDATLKNSPFLTQMGFPIPTNPEVTILELMNSHEGDESKINGSQVLLLSSRLQKSL